MKRLYLDCGMGAAGDMLTAALLELVDDKEAFVRKLNSLGIPDVTYISETKEKCGITGTHMKVLVHGEEEESHDDHHHHDHDHEHEEHHHDHDHEHEDHHHDHHHDHEHEEHHHDHHHDHEHHHSHSSMHDIEHIVREHLDIPDKVKDDVMAVYKLIAEAEGHVHNRPVDEIHFHEVGSKDAIADVVAVCMLINELGVEAITASPIHVGSGHVHCAHGVLPVPAPATAYILKDIPIYSEHIRGELCTPTGAALLKYFVKNYGDMPLMRVTRIGYGMGKKDFERANLVRAILGESEDTGDVVYELNCNIDDMTGEKIGFATERLFEAGALDVYTIPVNMKKNRPGILLKVLCNGQQKEKIIENIFRYTSTLGIREQKIQRHILDRRIETVNTEYGDVRVKVSEGYGVKRCKPEYEDLANIAKNKNISIDEVERLIDLR